MIPYFIFNGKSSTEFDIFINKLPPIHSITNAKHYEEIDGRDGFLSFDLNRKEPINKQIIITVYPKKDIQQIKRWLRGSGEVTFSTEPDVFFKCEIQSLVEYEGAGDEVVAIINFKCQPNAYLIYGQQMKKLTVNDTLLNNEYEKSYPTIKIIGNGAIEFYINNEKLNLNITGHLVIDSEYKESYVNDTPETFKGAFPVFNHGINKITWTGSVDAVEVIPNWIR